MEAVTLLSTRGPVRVGELTHPRPPRHLPRQQLGEDKVSKKGEEEAGTNITDGGDASGTAQGLSLDQKELSVIEKHQLKGPSHLRAQLRRNSLVCPQTDPEQVSQPLSCVNISSNPEERTTALRQVQSSGNLKVVSQNETAPALSEQQIEALTNSQRTLSIKSYMEQRRLQLQQAVINKVGSASVAVNASDTVAAGNQNVNCLHADVRRSPSPQLENLKNDSFHRYTSPMTGPTGQDISSVIPRRNSLQDFQSSLAPTSNINGSGSKTDSLLGSSVGTPTIAPYTSRHKNFLQSLYHRSVSSPSATITESGTSSLSSASLKMSPETEDLDSTNELASPRHAENENDTSTKTYIRENGISRSSGTNLRKNSERSLMKVKDFENNTVIPTKRGEWQTGREMTPTHSTPVSKRQIMQLSKVSPQQAFNQSSSVSDISSLDSESPEKNESGRQPVAQLNYCKLKITDRYKDQHSFITLVAPEMSNLLGISALLTEKRDAEIVKFGTSTQDLVDEMSQQIGAPLIIQKLYALPSGGRYSPEELLRLSGSQLAHQKPADWDRLVNKFEQEGIEGILLKSREVKCFDPSNHKLPTGERIYRIMDGYSRTRDNSRSMSCEDAIPGQHWPSRSFEQKEGRGRDVYDKDSRHANSFKFGESSCGEYSGDGFRRWETRKE